MLIWFAGAAGVLLGFRAARARRGGWVVASAVVLVVTVAGAVALPGVGGYIGGAALMLLVMVPLFGYRLAFRYTLKQDYAKARRLAWWLRWLHPGDGWLEWPHLLAALESRDPDTIAATLADMQGRNASRTGIGRLAAVLLYRMSAEWEALRGWLETDLAPAELRRDPNMVGLYLRAHGELGDPNGLLDAYERLSAATEGQALWVYRNMCRLMAFAFCGRRELVERLFAGPLDLYPQPVQRLWLATADMAAGRVEEARAELEAIRDDCDPLTAAGIDHRLAHPLPIADDALTEQSQRALLRIETGLGHDERYGGRVAKVRRTAYATYTLIVLNLAIFVLEMARGGSTNIDTLFRLGALHPTTVAHGEWWRVLTGLFLHYGPVHLSMNLLALLVLGPFLEFAVGWWRYTLAYLVSGVGSMLAIVLLALAGQYPDTIVVGASGSIMGLVGATAAVHLRGWLREHAPVASRRLLFVAFVIAFQVVFDLATPEVSFLAHFGGVVIGFVVASLMRHHVSGRSTSNG